MTRLLTLLLLVTLTFSSFGQNGNEIILDIVDKPADYVYSSNLSGYNNKDVEILKGPLSFAGETSQHYSVFFYHNIGGVLKKSGAHYGSDVYYTKAYVNWLNDSTIAVKLFDPETDVSYSFKAFGTKRGSGLKIPD